MHDGNYAVISGQRKTGNAEETRPRGAYKRNFRAQLVLVSRTTTGLQCSKNSVCSKTKWFTWRVLETGSQVRTRVEFVLDIAFVVISKAMLQEKI